MISIISICIELLIKNLDRKVQGEFSYTDTEKFDQTKPTAARNVTIFVSRDSLDLETSWNF